MARGLAAVLNPEELTVVVNVGDDDVMHGVHVAADLDTVTYTLAGREGPHGWGLANDTFSTMDALALLGEDTSFRIGDSDLATCLMRTTALAKGEPLSSITDRLRTGLGVKHPVLPATDDNLMTNLLTTGGEWLSFQEYFVVRRHRDEIAAVRYEGAETARPGPGVLEAIATSDAVVIAPSNPPLSIHPILAMADIATAVRASNRVVAVSPLFSGRALKGPADRIMRSLGLPPGTSGVLATYDAIIHDLIIDSADGDDAVDLAGPVAIHATDTRIKAPESAARFARWLLELL